MLLILLACSAGSVPDKLEDCSSLECKRAWMAARWEGGAEGVMDAVAAEADPVVQTVLVQDLSQAHPGHTAALCERLPAGATQRRCQSLNTRPHLWQIDLETPSAGSQGSGKVFLTLNTHDPMASPWAGQEPRMATCPSAEAVNTCQVDLALRMSQQRRYQDAGLACLGIPEEKWRYECFFEAADVGFVSGRGGRVSGVVQLCMGSGPYLSRCLGHLMVAAGRRVPSSELDAPAEWRAVNGLVAEVRGALKEQLPELSERGADRVWAGAAALSYVRATRVTGIPLEHTDPEAAAHIRAAAAARLWVMEAKRRERGADYWVARLKAALADRTPSKAGGPIPEKLPPPWTGDWEVKLAGEEALPRIAYQGDAWRTVAADEDADLLICLLEAAARGAGERDRLFTDAAAHPEPLVRWTAARLMASNGSKRPVPGVLELAAEDPHPLVRARGVRGLEPGR